MNPGAQKDEDQAKLHQSRSFNQNISEPALVGGSLLTLKKAQENKKKKRKEGKIKEINSNQAKLNSNVLENGAK